MRQKHIVALSLILAFSLVLSACSALGLGATPTPDPLAQQATIDAAVTQAMQAISANLTSTAAALPSSTFTVTPTQTPASTATPMATATKLIPTATKTLAPAPAKPTATATPSAYTCKVIATLPAAGTKVNVSMDFDASWTVKNVGTKGWDVGYVDLRYDSGTKMQTGADIYDVTTAVAAGADLTFVVDMRAPATAGKYTASWIVTLDGATMCTLPLSIEAVTP